MGRNLSRNGIDWGGSGCKNDGMKGMEEWEWEWELVGMGVRMGRNVWEWGNGKTSRAKSMGRMGVEANVRLMGNGEMGILGNR